MPQLLPGNWTLFRVGIAEAFAFLALFALLCLYGSAEWVIAGVSVLVFGSITVTGSGLCNYLHQTWSFQYARAVCVALSLLTALGGVLAVYSAAYGGTDFFLHDIYLFLAAGITLWAFNFRDKVKKEGPERLRSDFDPQGITAPQRAEVKDAGRITVKKGQSLHIIETQDILYIQAMGDYVSIVTEEGRYVKEGTMVYYENVLPADFARIHRSVIVNISCISTIELYGKQSYSVRLANGESLKASATGYRTLKDKLKG